ncbi:ComEC family competence protein [Candidatus Giovannonibacteria bacterium]|nr:ComEC family competence protein [Candidatus Giovannonibacteria bacterium]
MNQKAYFKTQFFILAFLGGVMLRSFFNVPQNWVLAGLGLVAGLFLVKLWTSDVHSLLSVLIAFFVLFLLGMLRFSFFENNISGDVSHNFYEQKITVSGSVISEKIKESSSQLILETDHGRLLIIKRIYPPYKYGDKISVSGVVEEPKNFNDFDYKKYLAKSRIYSQMFYPEIKKVDEFNNILSSLFSLKNKFEQNIQKILPEPHASLSNGMLLGIEGRIDDEILELFKKTSTIHILVLSGYNITIVGVFVMGFFNFFLPSLFAWILAVLGIVAFTLMTGGEPAATRAAIMGIIGLIALRTGRTNRAFLALLWAALLMAIWNPMLPRFDRGFQLSFMATLGLIFLSNFFKRNLKFLPNFFSIRESAASTLSAQIFVLPFLISWGNEVLWVSPVANLFVVGVVPIIMFFSFAGGLASFISVSFGKVIASVAYVFISYQIFAAKIFAGLF